MKRTILKKLTACLCLFLLYYRRHKHLDAQRIDGMKG